MPKFTFKILSIDGGGIRGVIPAVWLSRIEDDLAIKRRGSLLDHFDLFAGTSTGSIIAAGLAIGRSAESIRKLYFEQGNEIFPPPLRRNPFRYFGALLPAYNGEGLDHVLKKEFGELALGDTKKRLLIAAFNGSSHTLRIFDSGDPGDKKYLLRDLIRASCSAPTYFPAKEVVINATNRVFMDGGLAANNPAAQALARAFKLGHFPNNILLISLGTGVPAQGVSPKKGRRRGLLRWALPIVGTVFDATSSANEQLIDLVLPTSSYFRVQLRNMRNNPALDRTHESHLKKLQDEAAGEFEKDATRYRRLINALTADTNPALALNGRWKSHYTWNVPEEAREERSDWEEDVILAVSGQEVTGYTTQSRYPFRLRARIVDRDVVGQTISAGEKSFKLRGAFVMRLDVDNEDKLKGYWVGTGSKLYAGDWTLTRTP